MMVNQYPVFQALISKVIDEAQLIGIDVSRLTAQPAINKWYQLPIIGKAKSNKSGRLKLITDSVAYLQNFITGEKATVFADDQPTDPKAIAERKRAIRLAQDQANREQEKAYKEIAVSAFHIWHDQCEQADFNHGYLRNKRLTPVGVKQRGNSLVIPVYSLKTGKVESLQFIQPDGSKRFLTGGRIKGNCFAFRKFNPATDKRIILSEGYATSQSLIQHHKLIGWHIVAFNSGNLLAVAKQLRQLCPHVEIIIAGDNDHQTAVKLAEAKGIVYDPTNPDHERFNAGVYHAKETAKAVGGRHSIPKFSAEERAQFPNGCTDWLDRWLIDQHKKQMQYVGA